MILIKRFFAYLLNKICIIVPTTFVAIHSFYTLHDIFEPGALSGENGWVFLYQIIYSVFLPYGGYSFYIEIPDMLKGYRYVMGDLELFLSVLLSYIFVESIILTIFKTDVGSTALELKIREFSKIKPSFLKILFRTTIKYISIAFFLPILLFPLFNKRRLFFHEWVSGVYKCDKREIVQLDNNSQEYFLNNVGQSK